MLIFALVVVVLVVLAIALAVIIYGTRVHELINRRKSQQKPLSRIENSFVSEESLGLLTHRFEEDEEEVYWADRQHVIVWLPSA
ncbi:MAG: hypothetical protein ACREGB_04585, partial [Candidatus Saccharimonadales bacterium]